MNRELFVKIFACIVRPLEEHLEDEQGDSLVEFCILFLVQELLERFSEVVPCRDECLIPLQVRNLQVPVNADLRLSGNIAASVCYKIAEGLAVVFTAEREEPAESGTKRMNSAAAVIPEECTAYVFPAHEQIGENKTVFNAETDPHVDEIGKAFFQVACEHEYVIGIEMNRVIHAMAAFAASVAGFAGYFREIAGGHEFVHISSILRSRLPSITPRRVRSTFQERLGVLPETFNLWCGCIPYQRQASFCAFIIDLCHVNFE